jgi:hypothetical protein
MPITSEIIEACNAVVDKIQTSASTSATVTRVYLAPENLATITGRKVYVFPTGYGSSQETREADRWTYSIWCRIIEKYTDPGEPTVAWMDDRVNWVREHVIGALDIGNKTLAISAERTAWTTSTEAEVYDSANMENEHLFIADVKFEFTEILASVRD